LTRFQAEDPQLADAYSTFSLVLRGLRRWSAAEQMARRVIAINEKTLGSKHRTVAYDLSNLASIVEAQGRKVEAEGLYQRALDIRTNALSADDWDIAWNHYRLGVVAENRSNYRLAVEHYRKAAAIVSERAIEVPRRSVTSYDEAAGTSYVFKKFVRAAYNLGQDLSFAETSVRFEMEKLKEDNKELMAEAFQMAQWIARSEAESALLQ
jgi:tetratricopeptide (TPR) repeat protein